MNHVISYFEDFLLLCMVVEFVDDVGEEGFGFIVFCLWVVFGKAVCFEELGLVED